MNITTYNKLVRDKIPEIIESNGEIPEVEVMDDFTYSKKLDEKLLEECKELISTFDKNSRIEEMADVLEVLHAMADVLGIQMSEVEEARIIKKEKRGAFKEKLLLKKTTR